MASGVSAIARHVMRGGVWAYLRTTGRVRRGGGLKGCGRVGEVGEDGEGAGGVWFFDGAAAAES